MDQYKKAKRRLTDETGISEAQAESLFAAFRKRMPVTLSAMDSNRQDDHFEELLALAHQLSGLCANLRLTEMVEIAFLLESAAKVRDSTLCEACLEQMNRHFTAFQSEFEGEV